MGLVEKVKGFMLGPEEDYLQDDDYDDEVVEYAKREREPEVGRNSSKGKYLDSNVVSMPAVQKERLVISRPKTMDDSPAIADYLRMDTTCVVNLEGVDHTDAQRIADFIGGAAYALSCDIERISNEIFIVAPAHVGVSNEVKEEIKSGGHVLPWISAFR